MFLVKLILCIIYNIGKKSIGGELYFGIGKKSIKG